MRCGADAFGVANLAEAQAIRRVGTGWPILLLGASLPDEADEVVRDGLTATLSGVEEARMFSAAAERLKTPARVHMKVDTGMGRLGAMGRESGRLARELQGLPGIRWEGTYTHFASSEDDAAFTRMQLERFSAGLVALREQGAAVGLVHASNSGGLLHEPDGWFDMVRPGLLIYGILPPGGRRLAKSWKACFRPALSLKARVTLVRWVSRGATVSYGHTYTASRRMRLGVVSAGYGDGYPRAAGNGGTVLIGGRRCPVVGRITMDQTVVDVSAVRAVASGDEVVLLGSQGREEIRAEELAGWCGTIPWEILTGISYRVPRIYRGAQAS
jgi:alanine racemase